ncbi:hypothetical protein OLX02_12840 [Novosphingobium sp. KCTC 2891]|uniref:hypothetical protein n=1 Tax=Novosphingobium sp. KCTC 2891 TaxID=2989730 RepID=UPI00222338AE|nr:hypothetical protein [Novosphingobium sp. KCTC 2891]MCW1383709.1 hypothetical protein [Novosphingobium sp. KCTC 2891]
MARIASSLRALAPAILLGALLPVAGWPVEEPGALLQADAAMLERARATGDLHTQRRIMWANLARLANPPSAGAPPRFLNWASPFPPSTQAGGQRPDAGDIPLILFIHANAAADRHIRAHRLDQHNELARLHSGASLLPPGAARRIAPFPPDAAFIMSAWWPVAAHGETPMPVWDAGGGGGSGSYLGWKRVLAVSPAKRTGAAPHGAPLAFAGRIVPRPPRFALGRFVHIRLTAKMAAGFAGDPAATKLARLTLGRPLRAGDFIALVGLHMMTAQLPNGLWATWWWHDRAPSDGADDGGRDRPADLSPIWRNYRMNVAFDPVLPREADGSPHICFNPWFDAALPDQGQGGGQQANCISCHARAGYPLADFTFVTRGAPDTERDGAHQPGQLHTGNVWSIARAAAAPSR